MADGRTQLTLGFGAQYAALAAAGFVGTIPFVTWTLPILLTLFPEDHSAGSGLGTLAAVAGGAFALLLLAGPQLTACLVLRARQPRGARIEWDDEKVVEWDGAWKRSVVRWATAEAALAKWEVRGKGGSTTFEAVQIRDPSSGAVVTVWQSRPKGAPLVRRRLYSRDVPALRAFVEEKGVRRGSPDWSLAADPDRPVRAKMRIFGRLGYLFGVAAVLCGAEARAAAVVLGVASVAALLLRAYPAFAELRAIAARLAEPARPQDGGGDPYRVADVDASVPDGRRAADRSKAIAVLAELFVRLALPVLVAAATIISVRMER